MRVGALAEEAVEMLASAATAAAIRLEAEVPPDLPLAWGDEARIVQLLGNLIGNALKFTPEGGQVRITAALAGAEIVVSVSDTGAGIPPDQVPHLFDRFWQAKKTDRRGAGLGLAIARGIVEAHGGRIWAESEAGHGSRFLFSLPLVPAAAVSKAEAPRLVLPARLR